MTNEQIARGWTNKMAAAGLTPDEMLEVIRMAREKYRDMKNDKKTKMNVNRCTCSVDEATGWTCVKCCNICGKPLKDQNWHCG